MQKVVDSTYQKNRRMLQYVSASVGGEGDDED